MRKHILPILPLLCAAAVLFAAGEPRRAPGFSLPDVKGQEHDLADYRGKVVLLEFMQTTCPHCAAFAAILNGIQQRYGDRVAILAVANPPDNQTAVNQYIASHQVAYPILFDCGQMAYSYVLTRSIDLPHLYVIDPNGMIKSDYVYNLLTRDIFEGKGLYSELDLMVNGGQQQRKK
jgi:peroxiredoxin